MPGSLTRAFLTQEARESGDLHLLRPISEYRNTAVCITAPVGSGMGLSLADLEGLAVGPILPPHLMEPGRRQEPLRCRHHQNTTVGRITADSCP